MLFRSEVGVSVENLSDAHYAAMGFDNTGINGLAQRYPGMPRWVKAHVNYKFSPKSGRVKIKAPNSGRFVYANGTAISLAHLKSLAATLGVNIKGLRSKANIAQKLFPK